MGSKIKCYCPWLCILVNNLIRFWFPCLARGKTALNYVIRCINVKLSLLRNITNRIFFKGKGIQIRLIWRKTFERFSLRKVNQRLTSQTETSDKICRKSDCKNVSIHILMDHTQARLLIFSIYFYANFFQRILFLARSLRCFQ